MNASNALTNHQSSRSNIISTKKKILSFSDSERRDDCVDLFIKLFGEHTSNITQNEYLKKIYQDFKSTI